MGARSAAGGSGTDAPSPADADIPVPDDGDVAAPEAVTAVLERVRPRVVPTADEVEAVHAAAEGLVDAVRAACADLGVDAEPLMVGSVAKGTWVRGDVDLDCFLLFPPDVPRDQLEEEGLAVGRAVLGDGTERYAEHPYIRGTWEDRPAEVVPCYDVDSPADLRSAVDRTPFHNRHVIDHLAEDQHDEVRLLKRFMAGVGVYGAETRTQGFSGYLAEVLVLDSGSFLDVLRKARLWDADDGVALDPEDHAAPTFDEPLVVVDPVDPGRNVAAAVSRARLRRFAEACRAFLAEPSEAFFFPPDPPVHDADRLGEMVGGDDHVTVGLVFARPDLVEDNLYPQLQKAEQSVTDLFEAEGFTVGDAGHHVDEDGGRCLVVWDVAPRRLDATYVHEGPPVRPDLEDHRARFRAKWEDHPDAAGPVEEDDGRLVVEVRRARRDPGEVLAHHLALDELGLGKQVGDAILEDHEVLVGADLVQDAFRPFLSELFEKVRPWEREA